MQSTLAGSESLPSSTFSLPTPPTSQSVQDLRQTSFAGIISQCSKMQRVFSVLEKVSQSNTTVLILGESGTGKELIARAVHRLSKRTGKIVPVNCGAIPEEILESELFGHEKGAFTGAIANKIGRFQLAEGGTIFLDEIGEMSPKLQVKLLRVLQERVIEPVGSTRSIPVDVRVVAATNKDLWSEVQGGRFREDLFYRLQVVPVELPALRDRGNDTEVLARYFIEREAKKTGRPGLRFSGRTLQCLRTFDWPGNVRELENLVERVALLAESDEISESDLPSYMREARQDCEIIETPMEMPEDGLDFNTLVNQFEDRLIILALDKTGWNKKAAAKLLNLNRTTLVEKIKKKGLESEVTVEAYPSRLPLDFEESAQ